MPSENANLFAVFLDYPSASILGLSKRKRSEMPPNFGLVAQV